jgi:hypothetical protein
VLCYTWVLRQTYQNVVHPEKQILA